MQATEVMQLLSTPSLLEVCGFKAPNMLVGMQPALMRSLPFTENLGM